MSDTEPNYAEMSLRELLDVAQHIDRQRFPDRWERLSAEIAGRRHQTSRASATSAGESHSDERLSRMLEPPTPVEIRNAKRDGAILGLIDLACVAALAALYFLANQTALRILWFFMTVGQVACVVVLLRGRTRYRARALPRFNVVTGIQWPFSILSLLVLAYGVAIMIFGKR